MQSCVSINVLLIQIIRDKEQQSLQSRDKSTKIIVKRKNLSTKSYSRQSNSKRARSSTKTSKTPYSSFTKTKKLHASPTNPFAAK